ncbi:MAG: hypothetical protein JSV80_12655 [Acidobacteriota bacterium]|nr:MAG: hypothetical protein JSV80_12655 [Acidobacteriota bacterium]
MNAARDGDLIAVADAHLGAGDAELGPFCAFLAERAVDTAVLVLLGDIFSLWLGAEKFTLEHHRRVLETCVALRSAGVHVVFVEGNREFGAQSWQRRAFDEVADRVSAAPWAGARWLLAHGNRLAPDDRRDRVFRWATRSRLVLGAFGVLPSRLGLRIADRIERALRHQNLRHKTSITRERLERYGRRVLSRGYDAAVIGHLHVEMSLEIRGQDASLHQLYVLPDWRSGRRFLRIPRQGRARFESWGSQLEVPAAVLEAIERREQAEIRIDRFVQLAVGDRVAISSGHGHGLRRGRVLRVVDSRGDADGAGRPRLLLELEQGPPVQAGDRLIIPSRGSGRAP